MDRPHLRRLREPVTTHDPNRLSRKLGHQLLLAEELEQDQAQMTTLQARREMIEQLVAHVGPLIAYWERVRQQLSTFNPQEKRLALEALDIRIVWTPDQP